MSNLESFWEDEDNKTSGPRIRQAEVEVNLGTGTERSGSYKLPAELEIPVTPIASAPVQENFRGSAQQEEVTEISIGIDEMLNELLELNGSDLHLVAGMKPLARVHGNLQQMEEFPTVSSDDIRNLVYSFMTPAQRSVFEKDHDYDLAYSLAGRSRFRVNVFQQMAKVGSVMRAIPNRIKTLEELGMPDVISQFAGLPRGLVLVTGPTGSGKSTTLAAILDLANRTRSHHIITFEDPIEFVHQNKMAIVNQREVGVDVSSFKQGLRQVLREDPDIILVGEMRDYETISAAITAAETGHLVFGTLHTQSAADTMSRIIDAFPAEQQNQVKTQLAATLQGIVSQTLLRTIDGKGRIAATEILVATDAIRALVREGKPTAVAQQIETGGPLGMKLLDQNLKELVSANKITLDEALEHASNEVAFITLLGGPQALPGIRRRQREAGQGFTRGSLGGL